MEDRSNAPGSRGAPSEPRAAGEEAAVASPQGEPEDSSNFLCLEPAELEWLGAERLKRVGRARRTASESAGRWAARLEAKCGGAATLPQSPCRSRKGTGGKTPPLATCRLWVFLFSVKTIQRVCSSDSVSFVILKAVPFKEPSGQQSPGQARQDWRQRGSRSGCRRPLQGKACAILAVRISTDPLKAALHTPSAARLHWIQDVILQREPSCQQQLCFHPGQPPRRAE